MQSTAGLQFAVTLIFIYRTNMQGESTTPSQSKHRATSIDRQYHHSFASPDSPCTLISIAIWFGLLAGLGEGLGLLLFQRINWVQWARVIHVSRQILWISPCVSVVLFLAIGLIASASAQFFARLPIRRYLVFALAFLTVYDWLLTTRRLHRTACLLLALGLAVTFARWLKSHEASAVLFWRRSVLPFLAAVAVLAFALEFAPRMHEAYLTARLSRVPAGTPNILVIVLDTLRADHLASYGYRRTTSPQIDALAQQGVLFENAIAPSSWSLPSHASLLTGRAVHDHGFGNVRPMPWLGWGQQGLNGLPTLGESLTAFGYRSAAFSANRVYFTSNVGLGRGFSHFEDYFDGIGDSFVRTQWGREVSRAYMNRSEKSLFTRVLKLLGLASWLDKDSEGSGEYGGAFGIRKRGQKVNREAINWMRRDAQHPFFAFLNYLDVHYSYGGPPDHAKPDWDRGSTIDEYDAGIKYDDDCIGQLMAELDQAGVLQNTLVIITSDHGESLGDHGLSYHGSALYWELVHVPLIIAWPGHVPAGVRVRQPVSIAAIPATVLQLIGSSHQVFPGTSLSDLWAGPQTQFGPQHDYVLSELPQTNTIVKEDRVMQGKEPLATDGSMSSMVTRRWHLITHEKYRDQLYDWTTDPGEIRDVMNTPEGKAAAAALHSATLP
jgi:arylsulfatase A-like enzyme